MLRVLNCATFLFAGRCALICSGGVLGVDFRDFAEYVGVGSYYAKKAVISCKGMDLVKGVTDSNELLAGSKRAMLESSRQKILVADSSKFGAIAFTKIADIREFDVLVTDTEPEEQWKQYLEECGIEIRY